MSRLLRKTQAHSSKTWFTRHQRKLTTVKVGEKEGGPVSAARFSRGLGISPSSSRALRSSPGFACKHDRKTPASPFSHAWRGSTPSRGTRRQKIPANMK